MSEITSISNQTFTTEVLESSIPVLIDFWAPWCVPCKMIAPLLEKSADKFKDRLKIVKLNSEENKELADKYQIMSIPSIVMFSKGKEIGRIAGVMDENRLNEEVEDLLVMAT